MSRVLYIQASPRVERSYSIAVADSFVEAYKKNNPEDEIVKLNVFDDSLSAFDGPVVQAKYKILQGRPHSSGELETWKKVEQVIEQFTSADKYLLAVPMWNFSIPYRLKQYIDLLIQPGYTFAFSQDKGYEGLVTGKPMLAIYSRGGQYPPGSDPEAMYRSLNETLRNLPDDTLLYPGHLYSGDAYDTLGNEKRTNPFLRVSSLEQFLGSMGV